MTRRRRGGAPHPWGRHPSRPRDPRGLRYTARPAAPDFHAARELAVRDQLRRRLHGLGDLAGAYIFGSFAARTDSPDSDVDVLLVGDMDRPAFQQDFWQLELRLGRSVNVVEYQWEDFQLFSAGC